ncbi:4-hydroxyphenylpyruvate dioxygenase-like protein [Ylistrum balloti]|uniref:4-hydroxyphenylpyruvate dioxygenase-like protein n=1 Tax=Ylistrum balloti TaxID=509963 RepID=UPI002905CFC7|nr:4-hydroxyphenylpyruvate dioxygenase-like protein [Ylistrum balloti]
MEADCVHHIEILTRDGEAVTREFVSKYNFVLFAKRSCSLANQWVLKSRNVIFVVTQSKLLNHASQNNKKTCDFISTDDFYVVSTELEYKGTQTKENGSSKIYDEIDTVNNVALKVKNVGSCLQRLKACGATILKKETKIVDNFGEVDLAIVKSCVGNVIHTLLNCDKYKGAFLPYFDTVPTKDVHLIEKAESETVNLTHFDHVTFACEVGTSSAVLQWYEDCLGLTRFFMNSDEDADDGFVINTTDIGLRLKAMEYWHCAEIGITAPQQSKDGNGIKFVIAEALPDQGPNQVATFLTEHGGPGIQHIGLHTPDIVTTVSCLMTSGVEFAEPPYTYYTEVGKLEDIKQIGQCVAILETNGILVDMEVDRETDSEEIPSETHSQDQTETDGHSSKKYLMQKFTKPLFDRNTFFLEVIHRCGATGFGSGNITALWRSVQAYMSSQQKPPVTAAS